MCLLDFVRFLHRHSYESWDYCEELHHPQYPPDSTHSANVSELLVNNTKKHKHVNKLQIIKANKTTKVKMKNNQACKEIEKKNKQTQQTKVQKEKTKTNYMKTK